jgi:hypothetical protein
VDIETAANGAAFYTYYERQTIFELRHQSSTGKIRTGQPRHITLGYELKYEVVVFLTMAYVSALPRCIPSLLRVSVCMQRKIEGHDKFFHIMVIFFLRRDMTQLKVMFSPSKSLM